MNKTEQLAIKLTQIYYDSLPRYNDNDGNRMDNILKTYAAFVEKLSGN